MGFLSVVVLGRPNWVCWALKDWPGYANYLAVWSGFEVVVYWKGC